MENKKIMLIVDDAIINREILRRIFMNDFEIMEACDGELALELIRKYKEEMTVVLLDIRMPKMDGFEVLDEIHKDASLKNIPIIAVTGEETSEVETLNKGAWDFISKPFDLEIVKSRVRNAIERKLRVELEAKNVQLETKTKILRYINKMPVSFVVLKLDENDEFIIDYCNDSYASMKNSTINDLMGLRYTRDNNSVISDFFDNFIDVAKNGNDFNVEVNNIYTKFKYYSIYAYSPEPLYCGCMIQDVTDVRLLERNNILSLERENKLLLERNIEQERYSIIINQTGATVFELNYEKHSFYASENFNKFEMSKIKANDLFKIESYKDAVHSGDIDKFAEEFLYKIRLGEPHVDTTVRLKKISGEYIYCKILSNSFFNNSNKLARNIGTIQDVNNEAEYLNQLKYDAEFDAITGIYNKRSFLKYASKLIKESDGQTSIIRFDINRFKIINELFGYDEGDDLLNYIASMGEYILNGYRSVFGRLTSDEFCICLEGSDEKVDIVIEKLEHIADEFDLDFDIVPSIGVYTITDKSTPVDVMCDRAKLALKTIKGNYLIRHEHFNEKLHQGIVKEQEIINMMNTAIEKEQFIVYLQPKYNLFNNTICGAEALVRWIHPTKGMIFPNDFIPIFERNGFIMKLDLYVWEKVCILLRKWLDEGKNPLPISVNISKVNLYNPKLCETIIGMVKKYDIPPKLFELELTESAYTDNKQLLDDFVNKLKDYGFIIMMDDFGSGYSSLNMLKEIAVDVLKIDMRFLSNEEIDSGKGANILTSVVRMAKWLNLEIIAEGIETKSQSDFLKSIGCGVGQGYYFSKPIPIPDYEKLIDSSKNLASKEEVDNSEEINIDEIWSPNAQVNLLFNSIISAIAIYEKRGDIVELLRVNDGYFSLTGFDRDKVYNPELNVADFVHPDDKEKFFSIFDKASKNRNVSEGIFRRQNDEGIYFYVLLKLKYLSRAGDRKVFYGALTNVDKEKKTEIELAKAHERLQFQYSLEKRYRESVIANSLAYFEVNLTQNLLINGSKQFYETLEIEDGISYDKFLNLIIPYIDIDDRKGFLRNVNRDNLLQSFARGEQELKMEYRVVHEKKNFIWLECILNIFQAASGEDVYCMWTAKNIDDKKKYELKLKDKAEKDALTGLYNSVNFQKLVTEYLKEYQQGSFFMFDIDNFKSINDTFGHKCGDLALKSTAKLLIAIFNDECYLARMGGDEFAVFIKGQTSSEILTIKARYICEKINKLVLDGYNVTVSCSLGIAVIDDDCNNYNKLYSNADKAQYYAKLDGKNRFAFYEDRYLKK